VTQVEHLVKKMEVLEEELYAELLGLEHLARDLMVDLVLLMGNMVLVVVVALEVLEQMAQLGLEELVDQEY
jgi:hypothetical protein